LFFVFLSKKNVTGKEETMNSKRKYQAILLAMAKWREDNW
jgi:hypothetical protein